MTLMKKERWVKINGFWGQYYAASSFGRIKNLRNGKILRPSISKGGYPTVTLKAKPKKWCIQVHALVLSSFCKKPSTKHECCHIDGTKNNNTLSNLRWGTRKENFRDKILHGRSGRKLSPKKVAKIKHLIAHGELHHHIAKKMKIKSPWTITQIAKGMTYVD